MSYVYVKLTRPEGYEDVCDELVIEDAHIHEAFQPEDATPEIGQYRDALYEISIIPDKGGDRATLEAAVRLARQAIGGWMPRMTKDSAP